MSKKEICLICGRPQLDHDRSQVKGCIIELYNLAREQGKLPELQEQFRNIKSKKVKAIFDEAMSELAVEMMA